MGASTLYYVWGIVSSCVFVLFFFSIARKTGANAGLAFCLKGGGHRMFQVGDKVVHPMHGAGVIDSIVREKISGKATEFYVFKMPISGLTLKIPTENSTAIGIRAIKTRSEIEEVIARIPKLGVDMTANWNHRYRENMDRLKSGDLDEVSAVIKALMHRDSTRGLSNGERKMLHIAKQILVSEIVLAEDVEYPEAEGRVNAAMLLKESD